MTKAANPSAGKQYSKELEDVMEEARIVKRCIGLMLKEGDVSYPVALTALAQVMLDIAVLGLSEQEQEARAHLASFFILDDVIQ
jgi:hypothetical protein